MYQSGYVSPKAWHEQTASQDKSGAEDITVRKWNEEHGSTRIVLLAHGSRDLDSGESMEAIMGHDTVHRTVDWTPLEPL